MGGEPPKKRIKLEAPIEVTDSDDSSSDAEDGQVDERSYTCRVCLKPEARAIYVCPKCLTRSCSLACSQQHKRNDQCDGKRDRVLYKAKTAITLEDLKQDLAVISDVSQAVESAARLDNRIAVQHEVAPRPETFSRSKKPEGGVALTRGAKDAIVNGGGVIFRQSPPCAERRKRNSTSYKRRKLKWRVEWNVTTVADAAPVHLAVKGHLAGCLLEVAVTHALKSLALTDAAPEDFVVLIVDEAAPSNERGYILLDQKQTIAANLRGLVIIDFPTLHLVAKPLVQVRSKSVPYSFDLGKLPNWAQPVVRTRLEHLYTYLSRPVYSRKFDALPPAPAAAVNGACLSPISDDDSDAEVCEVQLDTVEEEEFLPTQTGGLAGLPLPNEYQPEEEELIDDF